MGALSAYYHATDIVPKPFGFDPYSDILAFYDKAIEPGLPYIDKLIEYPVITGMFIHLAGVVGQTLTGYYLFNSFFLVAFAVVSTYFLYKAVGKEDIKALFVYWVLAPSMFLFLVYNWDMIVVMFVVIVLYFITRDRLNHASLSLALGFCTKLYPIIYLPALLASRRRLREWARIIGVFAAVALVINVPFMLINYDGWSYFISFHSERGPNIDSIWAVVNTLVPGLTITQMNVISLALFASASLVALWKCRNESIIKLCFIVTLIFLLSNKVFSPQYALWLLPFYVLLPMRNRKLFYAM